MEKVICELCLKAASRQLSQFYCIMFDILTEQYLSLIEVIQ